MHSRILFLAALLACAGCGKSDRETKPITATFNEPPSTRQETAPWMIQRDKLMAVIKTDMTQAEVTKAAGEPSRAVGEMNQPEDWEYDVGDNRRLVVHFDKDRRVGLVEMKTGVKPQ